MKKKSNTLKVILSFATFLCIAGAILIGIGFANGGDVYQLGIRFSKDSNFHFSSVDEYIKTYDFIHDIDVDMKKGSVTIEEGTTASVRIEGMESEQYTLDYDDGVLKFKEESDTWLNIGLFSKETEITITVPNDSVLNKVKVNNDMGSIDITDITSKEFTIRNNMGSVDLDDITSEKMNIKNDLGEISVYGLLKNQSIIENRLGNIEVSVYDSSKYYSYDVDNGLGNTDIVNGNGTSKHHSADTQNRIELSNNLGNIDLVFLK